VTAPFRYDAAAAEPAPAGPRGPGAAAALIVLLLMMPLLYGLVAFHGHYGRMLKAPILEHVAFNCLTNAVVMVSCRGLHGRFDQRLSQVFARTLLAHGALAFFTLVTRHYYSIPMMMVGVPASVLLGTAVTVLDHRGRKLSIGILGPWHAVATTPGLDCRLIEKPDASIQPYDLLLVTFPDEAPPPWAPTLTRALLAGKRVRHVAEYLEELRGVVDIGRFDVEHLPSGVFAGYRTRKRLLDCLVAIAALPLAAPAVGLAALAVLVSMGRPVLFVQERVGMGGRRFRMAKLRTMRPADTAAAGSATEPGDPRITPLGHWLRRFHIDELPQLWNVLSGDMSLVGPRPEQPELSAAYIRQAPAFAYRQLVRPGITGWAQVRAPYAADLAETEVKLGYDLFYLKNISLALDTQIFARTVWTVISGAGAR
jgi:lipopolysaccharide/colanic/teichoic acid biosynthesis glycosyltransferase